jgi:8-oxo-dGTP pyrophosphatase MutT (NUDIX family)
MTDIKWKLLDKKPVFESKWMSIEDRSYELPDGKKVTGYFHLNRPDYVLILAINNKNQIVVERQYRRGIDEFVYELPAGWIESGESAIDAAKRELKEETGYLGEGDKEYEIYPQPGFSSMKAKVVVLKIIGEKTKENKGFDESITHELMSLEEIKSRIQRGEVKEMGLLSALNFI